MSGLYEIIAHGRLDVSKFSAEDAEVTLATAAVDVQQEK